MRNVLIVARAPAGAARTAPLAGTAQPPSAPPLPPCRAARAYPALARLSAALLPPCRCGGNFPSRDGSISPDAPTASQAPAPSASSVTGTFPLLVLVHRVVPSASLRPVRPPDPGRLEPPLSAAPHGPNRGSPGPRLHQSTRSRQSPAACPGPRATAHAQSHVAHAAHSRNYHAAG